DQHGPCGHSHILLCTD
nr:immunoglobulin heavy chain junction region [Homo sapiens]